MPITESQSIQLQTFFNKSSFAEKGGVVTDLDGTAIHEFQGQYMIPNSVELGLEKIYHLGRPVVLNTLRFPLSVMRTFAKEWYSISNAPIPTVLMNGSQLGYINQSKNGGYTYEEIDAFPLDQDEITELMKIVRDLLARKASNLLVFYYPRDWTAGEIIWTPVADKIPTIRNKYLSAASVYSGDANLLEEQLRSQQLCMIFLLIDLPQDQLMAYQHTRRHNFFTHKGVDKRSGAERISKHLEFDLKHSLGAGDSEMDTFLSAVGQAVHVGNPYLQFQGSLPAIRVQGSAELGELLAQLALMQKTVIHQ